MIRRSSDHGGNLRFAVCIDGQFIPMTGIQHYVDGLLGGLFQLDTPHEITAFGSYLLPSAIERAAGERPSTFAWHGLPRARVDATFVRTVVPAGFRAEHVWISRRVRQVEERLLSAISRAGSPASRSRRYDVLHVTEPTDLRFTEWRGGKRVATIHDLSTRFFPDAFPVYQIAAWERYFEFARDRCARVIAVSEATKRDIVEHLGISEDRVDVTPLAPRASTREAPDGPERRAVLRELGLGEHGKTPFVLYTGTIEPRKNVDTLIRAFADVLRQDPRLPHYLVLAGGTWRGLDADMRRLAADQEIGHRVLTTGYVTNAQLNALMSACDAFAYISKFEGFGMPPLEAMACGAPVIVANVSSLPEVVGSAGIQVDVTNQADVAAAIHCLLTDTQENQKRREKARERARQFSWERTARCTLDSYIAAAA